MGVAFSVVVADVEELEDGEPTEVALQNAARKVDSVGDGDGLVLGVDTVVSLNGRIYSKPADPGSAAETLRALSGRAHLVTSGLCLMAQDDRRTAVARTAVTFRRLEDALIEWYVGTDEWRDRAGGYAIQGRGAALVERIEGDYLNVVGLPLSALLELEPALIFGC